MFFSALLSAYNELLRLTQRVESDGTVPVENELKAQICSRSRILLTQAFFSHRQGTFAASKEINFHKFLVICTPSMRLTINHRKKKFEMRKSTQNLIRGKFSVEISRMWCDYPEIHSASATANRYHFHQLPLLKAYNEIGAEAHDIPFTSRLTSNDLSRNKTAE